MFFEFKNIKEVKKENLKNGRKHVFIKSFEDETKKIMQIRFPQGSSIGYHCHDEGDEVVYVLSGKGACLEENVNHPLEKGMVHYCPNNTSHSIYNDNEEEMIVYAIINK